MSWFHDNDLVEVGETRPDEEIADGVTVERRRVLMASATAAGALILGNQAFAAGSPREDSDDLSKPLSLDSLLKRALPMSRKLLKTAKANEDAYLFQLASYISRLQDRSKSPRAAMNDFRRENAVEGEERFPIAVVQLRLKPGGRLSHHDHRDYNGVIVGVQGGVRIRNYDILGKEAVPPEGKSFQIKETQDTWVAPGQFSMLSRRRNNVHDLRAGPDGATVLDVFTFFGRKSLSYWMDVDQKKPRDAKARIYDAVWRPRRRRR